MSEAAQLSIRRSLLDWRAGLSIFLLVLFVWPWLPDFSPTGQFAIAAGIGVAAMVVEELFRPSTATLEVRSLLKNLLFVAPALSVCAYLIAINWAHASESKTFMVSGVATGVLVSGIVLWVLKIVFARLRNERTSQN